MFASRIPGLHSFKSQANVHTPSKYHLSEISDTDLPTLPVHKHASSFINSLGKVGTRRQTLISKPNYKRQRARFTTKNKTTKKGQPPGKTTTEGTVPSVPSSTESDKKSRKLRLWNVLNAITNFTRSGRKRRRDRSTRKIASRIKDSPGEKIIRVVPNEFNRTFLMSMAEVQQNEALAGQVRRFAHVSLEPGISFAFHIRRVETRFLEDVIDYCAMNKDVQSIPYFDDDENPMIGVQDEKIGFLPPSDWEFIEDGGRKKSYVISLLQAATDLNNRNIIALCTNILAMQLTGKSVKKMRKFIGVKCDFTRKDWQRLDYENNFLIASDSDSDPEKDVAMTYNDLIVGNIYDHLDFLDLTEDDIAAVGPDAGGDAD